MDIVIPTDADIRAAWQAASVSPLWEDAAAHGGGRRGHVAHSWPWSTMEPLVNQALSLASTEVSGVGVHTAVRSRSVRLLVSSPPLD